jgi:hypothetical protein
LRRRNARHLLLACRASCFGISERTLHRWRAAGLLKPGEHDRRTFPNPNSPLLYHLEKCEQAMATTRAGAGPIPRNPGVAPEAPRVKAEQGGSALHQQQRIGVEADTLKACRAHLLKQHTATIQHRGEIIRHDHAANRGVLDQTEAEIESGTNDSTVRMVCL